MTLLTVVSLVDALLGCRSSILSNTLFRLGGSHGCYEQDSVRGSFSTSTFSCLTNRFPAKTMQRKKTVRSDTAATICERGTGFVSGDDTVKFDGDGRGIGFDNKTVKPFGLYIHIPYCRQRCRYCDFAIVPIGDFGAKRSGKTDAIESRTDDDDDDDDGSDRNDSIIEQQQQNQREQGFRQMNDRYVSAIIAELEGLTVAQSINRNGNRDKIPLRSIYFGGGTPSLAPIESIERILYHVCGIDNPNAPFRLLQQQQQQPTHSEEIKEKTIHTETDAFVQKTEITMEMDPGTFDRGYLSSLRDIGVDRVSLGVQSFDDDLLRAMGRTHRRSDILQAVRDIAFVFGDDKNEDQRGDNDDNRDCWKNVNYSIDLISGCPGLTPAKWTETLQEATAGVYRKRAVSTEATVALPTMNKRQPLLLSSLPPPKHISVYDMQIEEGTVFGKWAAKAKREAEAKKNDSVLPNVYNDKEDEDEDPSRQFTVKLPLEDSGESRRRGSRKTNQEGNPNVQERILRLPSEDDCAFMYKYAAGYLRAKNYEHYEVSSYAAFSDESVTGSKNKENDGCNNVDAKTQSINREGISRMGKRSKRSIHNQIYWEYDGQWFALGLGATSFVDKKLVARPREMSDYIKWVERGEESTASDKNKDGREEDKADDDDDDNDFLSDLLLKRLRTIDGLDLSWLEANHGSDTVDKVLEGAKLGLDLGLAEHTEGNILRLKDPDG